MNLRTAIESEPRAIVVCRFGRWAVTDHEGVEFDSLIFHDDVVDAMDRFCGRRPVLDAWERKTVLARTRLCAKHRATWIAEWWTRFGPNWLRPFGKLGGQVIFGQVA